jgi:hypothetical protein
LQEIKPRAFHMLYHWATVPINWCSLFCLLKDFHYVAQAGLVLEISLPQSLEG